MPDIERRPALRMAAARMQRERRMNRFQRAIDIPKHSSVIALYLDSAGRAG
jgi:hypothetical protein